MRLTPTCSSVNVAYCVRACAHMPPTVDMAEVSKKRQSAVARLCPQSDAAASFINESSLPECMMNCPCKKASIKSRVLGGDFSRTAALVLVFERGARREEGGVARGWHEQHARRKGPATC